LRQEKMHVGVTSNASTDVRYVQNAISRDTGREVTTVVRAMGDLDQALVAGGSVLRSGGHV
ncbi:MAG TPA: hypothetical protein VE155_13835, partial [Pseudonocardiaceae bacterium]|nr:hypothetical protein [Pseudonocardiaceae bacterium]